jgi:uncharacterized membrane protein required for colicin V production
MNGVDLAILGVIGASVLFGLYKGFIHSVIGLFGIFVAVIIAYIAYPQLAGSLQGNDGLARNLIHYSDASSRIHDLVLSRTPVAGIPEQTLDEIIVRAGLPKPIDEFVRANILRQVFAPIGSINVSEYLNQTVVTVSLNILCFLLCFGIAYAAIMLLSHLVGYVFRMPVLKHFDLILGGLFGGVRGALLVLILFAVVPVLLTVSPIEQVSRAIDESRLASAFYHTNLIQMVMKGSLF